MFDPVTCHVERNAAGDYELRWRCVPPANSISIYVTDDPGFFYHAADPGQPVMRTSEESVILRNPDKTVRHYFYLQSDHGEGIILAERQLSLSGTPNFRDLGGYRTSCGQKLKWGKLYRSGKLSSLTEEDMGYVRRLGLTLVCDFRQVVEQQLDPTCLGEDSSHDYVSLPVTPGSHSNFIDNLHQGIIAVDDASGFMRAMNRDMIANQMPRYAEMFQLLLSGDSPTLIHCASGKDRTGVGAALILDVLGVEEEAIVEDYLLSNRYLPIDSEVERLAGQFTDHSGKTVSPEVLRSLIEVEPAYIRACFEEIRERFQSREHFYESALQLDAEKRDMLKARLLH